MQVGLFLPIYTSGGNRWTHGEHTPCFTVVKIRVAGGQKNGNGEVTLRPASLNYQHNLCGGGKKGVRKKSKTEVRGTERNADSIVGGGAGKGAGARPGPPRKMRHL